MEMYESVIGEYDHTGLRAQVVEGPSPKRSPSRMVSDLKGGRNLRPRWSYRTYDVEGYPDTNTDFLLLYATSEMCQNADASLRQIEQSNLKFALDSCRGVIGLTAKHTMVEIHNIALAFHAGRAMRHFEEAMTMTPQQARCEASARGTRQLEQKEKGPLKDEDGISFNRCGAAILWMRGACPMFNMAVSPAPEGCDPQLRLVSTIFGVQRGVSP